MTRVPRQQTIGNSAAAYVAWRLAEAGCLVRPVADGTDVGIDLFCESTAADENGSLASPFLHFFVQVKGGSQCNVREDGRVSISVDVEHLAYWDRQPAPTFVALVPNVGENEPIYIVDIAQSRSGPTRALGDQKTSTLWSSTVIRTAEETRAFVAADVANATAFVQRNNLGVIAPDPRLTQGYIRTFHALHAAQVVPWMNKIVYQLRTTSAMTVVIAWRCGELVECTMSVRHRQLLHAVLAAWASFEVAPNSDPHWEVLYAAGLLAHLEFDFEQATLWYRESLRTIDGDPQLRPLPDEWRRDRDEVACCLAASIAKHPLPRDPSVFTQPAGS